MNMDPFKKVFNLNQAPRIKLALKDIPLKAQEMVGKMSISGVQPKLSVKLIRSQRELVTASSGEGEYIMKPQTQEFANTPENENCCMNIAESLKINVPPQCLLSLTDGSFAYVVKRFDRVNGKKIAQEDFYQILEKKDKYNGSVEEIGTKLKEVSSVPGLDVQLFYERVILNYLIGNGDAHMKNYSVYRIDGIRLTPAYDIVCSKLVMPKGEDSALSINGKNDKLRRKDFDTLGDYLDIPKKVRYEKFNGKIDQIKKHIQASKLPDEHKIEFERILTERYTNLVL